jgi:hypothetical protein
MFAHIVGLAKSVARMPTDVLRYYLSICLAWLLYFTSIMGIYPKGYIKASKLKEMNKIIEHLHAQGDLYRKAIRELKEDIETKDTDRKKALKKLKHTKEEINVLSENLSVLRRQYENDNTAFEKNEFDKGANGQFERVVLMTIHGSFLLTIFMMLSFSRSDCDQVLEWKIVMSIFFPIVWMYSSYVIFQNKRLSLWHILLLCSIWGVIGFMACALLHYSNK